MAYHGYTHLVKDDAQIKWWKKHNCKRGWHLWDEVWSDLSHYLWCDACNKTLNIEED